VLETGQGKRLKLSNGGGRLDVDGKLEVERKPTEYEDIYARFAELVRAGQTLVDSAPLRLVADCFLIGRRLSTEPFYD
jgi:D-galactose 1-dehydrogenase